MSLSTQLHDHGATKMESIGEMSNETSSSSPSLNAARGFSAHQQANKGKVIPPPKSTSPDSTVDFSLCVSGKKVDVSNLISESDSAPEHRDRKRIHQRLSHVNDIAYPKLPDEIDREIDVPALIRQQQQRALSPPTAPPDERSERQHHSHYPPSSPSHDRRAMWQQREFAQHSFTRRQQERSLYPYARSESQRQFAGELEQEDPYELRRRSASRPDPYNRESSLRYRRSREGSFRSRHQHAFEDRDHETTVEYPYSMGYNDMSDRRHHGSGRYPLREYMGSDQRFGTGSSRRRDRLMDSRSRASEVSCGSLAYVEDVGRGSSQRLRMSRDFDRELPQQHQPKQLEVEIAPGVSERLRGAEETSLALEHGRYISSDCMCCGARSYCIDDASYLLCPICKVVSPTGTGGESGGVGLGVLTDQY